MIKTSITGFIYVAIIELLQPVFGRAFDINDIIIEHFRNISIVSGLLCCCKYCFSQAEKAALINSFLSMKPSENAVISRCFASFVFQPYVFSLVFALTSRNKGN